MSLPLLCGTPTPLLLLMLWCWCLGGGQQSPVARARALRFTRRTTRCCRWRNCDVEEEEAPRAKADAAEVEGAVANCSSAPHIDKSVEPPSTLPPTSTEEVGEGAWTTTISPSTRPSGTALLHCA